MAEESSTLNRANIRIEIKNDFTEEMDVDATDATDATDGDKESSDGEMEEGEIDEPVESAKAMSAGRTAGDTMFSRKTTAGRVESQWTNFDGGFTTGVDIFAKDVQEKLQTRAQRFGLDPNESKAMTDKQLQELHESLGITVDDEVDTRFEAIHMYGTEEMSTQDVFSYFGHYGPAYIEWINDVSCNVVWHDRVSAARAFHGLSKPVRGMPVTGQCDPFKEQQQPKKENKNQNRSILLIKKDEEAVIENRDGLHSDISGNSGDQADPVIPADPSERLAHVSELEVAVPPGYWRLGRCHPKARCVLLRFARRTDKKPLRAERFSEYYKKYGNPNFGGLRGLISQSRKRKMRGDFPADKDLENITEEVEAVEPGNPWGSLARNWNNDVRETVDRAEPLPLRPGKSILERIGAGVGTKRPHDEPTSDTAAQPCDAAAHPGDGPTARRPDDDCKKSKVPRMKMYADEEEARVKKLKQTRKMQELDKIERLLRGQGGGGGASDLRDRLRQHPGARRRMSLLGLEPVREPDPEPNQEPEDHSSLSDDSDNGRVNVRQRSKVTVIVRKPQRPTVASTVWSRLDRERLRKIRESKFQHSDNEASNKNSESSESSDSDRDEHKALSDKIKSRPGFESADLKSRLGAKNSEHKSPLRIEINNDHYKS